MGYSMTISAVVNGQPVERNVPTGTTLLELVRDYLDLTGAKASCAMQVCGACTVLVDGLPVSACTYLACDVDGASMVTVEGLARGATLHPLQQAFIDHFAFQCGYCTPGFLLSAVALLADNPAPTREEVIEHLDGNLCRCTGYAPIVDAVLDAAARMRDVVE